MIPIVRRSVTVTTRQVVVLPYGCDSCGLTTQAEMLIEGVGRASALYVSADAGAAKQRALADAQGRARALVTSCPCPKCGAIPATSRAALARWELRAAARKKRRPFVGLGVLAAAALFAGSCSALTIAVNGNQADHGVSAGLVLLCFFGGLGAIAAAIAYGLAGPPRRPAVPTAIPPNVRFPSL